MKKLLFLLIVNFLFAFSQAAFSQEIYNHPISAQAAAKNMPYFADALCSFAQDKFLKISKTNLHSKGNFTFIKGKGVIFETTYPIQSTLEYTAAQNKNINSIIKSVTSKNYSYLEKNFDLYLQNTSQNKWLLALKPKQYSQLKGELNFIFVYGETKNNTGVILKMVLDSKSARTTTIFSNCR